MPSSPNCPPVRLRFIVAATGLLAAIVVLRPGPALAQSFDCRDASYRDEALICQEPDLARLDQQLATLYREQIGKVSKDQQDEFQRHEALFLHRRHECREHYRCIEQSYRNRIRELEDLLSEAPREGSSSAADTRPVDASDPHVPQADQRSRESDAVNAAVSPPGPPEPNAAGSPPGPPEPQSIERSQEPRIAVRTSAHHTKRSHATAAAATADPEHPATPSGAAPEHVAADRPPAPNDAPAKPTIKWVDPAPLR